MFRNILSIFVRFFSVYSDYTVYIFFIFTKGESAHVDLTIFGAKQIQKDSVLVDIVDINGKVLIPVIKPTRNDKNGLRYSFTFDPPSEQFKILIKGRTSKNKVFQRISQRASQVKPLVLKQLYNSGRDSIRQGGSAFIMLCLINGMDTDQVFRTSFRDTLGYKVNNILIHIISYRCKFVYFN